LVMLTSSRKGSAMAIPESGRRVRYLARAGRGFCGRVSL